MPDEAPLTKATFSPAMTVASCVRLNWLAVHVKLRGAVPNVLHPDASDHYSMGVGIFRDLFDAYPR